MTLEGESYHKNCFKCSHGGCILTTSSYAALNGILYCKIHFSPLLKEKGSYNHLIQTAQAKKSYMLLLLYANQQRHMWNLRADQLHATTTLYFNIAKV
jgi:hypothetical protein